MTDKRTSLYYNLTKKSETRTRDRKPKHAGNNSDCLRTGNCPKSMRTVPEWQQTWNDMRHGLSFTSVTDYEQTSSYAIICTALRTNWWHVRLRTHGTAFRSSQIDQKREWGDGGRERQNRDRVTERERGGGGGVGGGDRQTDRQGQREGETAKRSQISKFRVYHVAKVDSSRQTSRSALKTVNPFTLEALKKQHAQQSDSSRLNSPGQHNIDRSVCLFIYLSIHLSICLSIYWYI